MTGVLLEVLGRRRMAAYRPITCAHSEERGPVNRISPESLAGQIRSGIERTVCQACRAAGSDHGVVQITSFEGELHLLIGCPHQTGYRDAQEPQSPAVTGLGDGLFGQPARRSEQR